MKKREDKFSFTREEKTKMVSEIQTFFEDERDESLGIIASEKILDFFIDMLGEAIYNKALDETLHWIKKNIDNMESDYYSLYKN